MLVWLIPSAGFAFCVANFASYNHGDVTVPEARLPVQLRGLEPVRRRGVESDTVTRRHLPKPLREGGEPSRSTCRVNFRLTRACRCVEGTQGGTHVPRTPLDPSLWTESSCLPSMIGTL